MMRRVGIVAVVLLALVACCMIGWGAGRLSAGSAHPEDQQAVALAESLATARAEARANLDAWMIALQDRDTVIRRVVRYVVRHDTAWLHHVADSGKMIDTVDLVRWLAVSDSSQRVRGDSLAGELVQCRYDADQCADELQKRPTTCSGWSAFGAGVAVGFSSAAAGCVLVR